MVASAGLFATMTGIVRHVSLGMHPFEVGFFRYVFGVAALIPWILYSGQAKIRTRRLGLHFGRSLLALATVMFFFAAVSWMPLAEATALSFTAPFFTTLGAAIVLGEMVGRRRWAAVAIGFAGAMIILRPGFAVVSPPALLALASAATLAGGVLAVKKLSRTESADTIVLYMTGLMAVLSLPPALFVWTTPSPSDWGWLAALGLVGTLAQMSFVRSFRAADASVVLPFDYFKLLVAAVFGYVFFAEVPDIETWIGGSIIFAATLYTTGREARLERMRGAQ
jgi:drug/metabolite transporter (DMT)-like permease